MLLALATCKDVEAFAEELETKGVWNILNSSASGAVGRHLLMGLRLQNQGIAFSGWEKYRVSQH